jgi:hypothetical protein
MQVVIAAALQNGVKKKVIFVDNHFICYICG